MNNKKLLYTIIGALGCISLFLVIIFVPNPGNSLAGRLSGAIPSASNSLNPNAITNIPNNKPNNEDVTFSTFLPIKTCSAHFSTTKPANSIAKPAINLPLNYKDAAKQLVYWYFTPLTNQLDTPMAVLVNDLRRLSYLQQVDFTKEIKSFYKYFGLDLGNKSITDQISAQELNAVTSKILDTTNSYNKKIANLKITFQVVDDQTITITFDDYFPGEYGYNFGVDPNDHSLNAGLAYFDIKAPNLYEIISKKKIIIKQNPATDLPLFRYKYLQDFDANSQKYVSGHQAIITLKLEEPLEAERKYALEIDQLLFEKRIKGKMNVDRFDMDNSMMNEFCFPPSKFEFSKIGAKKEFNYNGGGNTVLNGIEVENDIWNSWNYVPLYAVAYSKDGRSLDIQPGQLNWSIVEGNGNIFYDEDSGLPGSKRPKLRFYDVPGKITVKVEYKGYTNQKTLYYVGGNMI